MKVALLTARLQSPEVLALCKALGDSGLAVWEIVCARNPIDSPLRHWFANNVLIRRIISRSSRGSGLEPCERISGELKRRDIRYCFFTQTFNSPKVIGYLRRLQPDLLINFRGPVYRKAMIETARIGVINCHMAILPEFRGMNVAEWSVLHGYPTGNTIHFIDPGIDTGRILAFFDVPVADCHTVEAMREKLFGLHHEHVARAVKLLVDGEIRPIEQEPGAGKQYFRMHPTLKERVERLLAQGYEPAVDLSARPYVYEDSGRSADRS